MYEKSGEKGMDQATEAESSENVSELKVLDIPVDENIEIPDTGSPNQVIKELEEYFDDIEEVYPCGNPSDKFLKNDFFDFSYLNDYDEVERY
jgi:hypothetical protein